MACCHEFEKDLLSLKHVSSLLWNISFDHIWLRQTFQTFQTKQTETFRMRCFLVMNYYETFCLAQLSVARIDNAVLSHRMNPRSLKKMNVLCERYVAQKKFCILVDVLAIMTPSFSPIRMIYDDMCLTHNIPFAFASHTSTLCTTTSLESEKKEWPISYKLFEKGRTNLLKLTSENAVYRY